MGRALSGTHAERENGDSDRACRRRPPHDHAFFSRRFQSTKLSRPSATTAMLAGSGTAAKSAKARFATKACPAVVGCSSSQNRKELGLGWPCPGEVTFEKPKAPGFAIICAKSASTFTPTTLIPCACSLPRLMAHSVLNAVEARLAGPV